MSKEPPPADAEPTDEALMAEIAAGRQEAVGLLYPRYAPRIFAMAVPVLDRPLGTTKWRIRAGLAALRTKLAPALAVVAFFALVLGLALRYAQDHRGLGRDERALTMLTSSDSQALRLTAAPGIPQPT